MIKLTKLCNKRRIEEERTPPENDFGRRVACLSHRLRTIVRVKKAHGAATSGPALARQRVFLIDCVEPSCANYSRNENLSTQYHRILVIKKQTSKNDFGPAEAVGRSQTRPVEFLGVYFFILVFMTIRALNFILLFVPQLVQHN